LEDKVTIGELVGSMKVKTTRRHLLSASQVKSQIETSQKGETSMVDKTPPPTPDSRESTNEQASQNQAGLAGVSFGNSMQVPYCSSSSSSFSS